MYTVMIMASEHLVLILFETQGKVLLEVKTEH